MPTGTVAGILALVVAVQAVDSRACSPRTPETTPAPTTPTPTPTVPPSEVFTTADGVRFAVDTVVTNLEIPWSMAFAPDGRLFVTERPGRVRIFDITGGGSEVTLTLTPRARQASWTWPSIRSSRRTGWSISTSRRA